VLMLDMTVYPLEALVLPVRKLEQSVGMTTYGPKHEATRYRRDMFSAVKLQAQGPRGEHEVYAV
jgi:hypothetical protein